jgi:uncharacterized membrane protein YgcG
MPYIAEKTGVFCVYEDYLQDLEHRLEMLVNLRNLNVRLSDKPVLEASSLPTPADLGGLTKAEWYKAHVHRDWHGSPTFTGGRWVQPPGSRTGWWKHWHGPAEKILREAFLRAIEVSLGIEHEAPTRTLRPGGGFEPGELPAVRQAPPDHPVRSRITRFWPIEILWVCGSPMLQGWVTWRKHGDAREAGQVTLLLTTPWPLWGHGLYLNPEPPTPPQAPADKDYKVGPGTVEDVAHPRGMWVVGADETSVFAARDDSWDQGGSSGPGGGGGGGSGGSSGPGGGTGGSSGPGGGGDGDDDGYSHGWYRGGIAVTVVRPTEADGGVLNAGRSYAP